VSGSDDKLGPEYGTAVTSVYARQLSRPALQEALRAGHAYVQLRGAFDSPTVDVTASTADGQRAMVGDTLYADAATVTVHVQGASGQTMSVTRDGLPAELVPITGDDVTHTFTAGRLPTSGPLGTLWRVDTFDARSLTTIGNPIFLRDPAARPATEAPAPAAPAVAGDRLPATGGSTGTVVPPALLAAAVAVVGLGVAGRSHDRGTGTATTVPPHG
jgi:hypothetical protein